jgi:hypothetical protein
MTGMWFASQRLDEPGAELAAAGAMRVRSRGGTRVGVRST